MSHETHAETDMELFAAMAKQMTRADQAVFNASRHGRVEVVGPRQEFVVYVMSDGKPIVKSIIGIDILDLDYEFGLRMGVQDLASGARINVSYGPKRLFDFPVFLSLPLSCKIRFREGRGVSWPVFIKTASRFHLQERGTVYCESSQCFAKEFGQIAE